MLETELEPPAELDFGDLKRIFAQNVVEYWIYWSTGNAQDKGVGMLVDTDEDIEIILSSR